MSAEASLKGKTRIVRVFFERGTAGLFHATSEDLDGLVLSARSIPELQERVPDVIERLYAACGTKVIVTPLDADAETDHETKWIAMSADVAKKALERAERL